MPSADCALGECAAMAIVEYSAPRPSHRGTNDDVAPGSGAWRHARSVSRSAPDGRTREGTHSNNTAP